DLRLRLPCKKLSPRYVGPFKILKQITPVSFRLDLPANYRISPTFHVSLLKPAGGPGENPEEETHPGQGRGSVPGQRPTRLQTPGRGTPVPGQWEGYGPEERSWVNARDVLDPSLKEAFHQTHPEKPAPRPRGRPRQAARRVGAL
ncbi:hypothetical protein M9458_036650, partial [Cirrhinus mrigala]